MWRGRGGSRRAPNAHAGPRQVCRFWNNGSCRYGKTCKYVHESSGSRNGDPGNGPAHPSGRRPPPSPMQEQFLDWKHTLPQSMFLSSSYLSVQTKSYLETALAFLDQDADVVHQVVRELASERVLAFIRSTVESAVVEIEPTASFKLWEEQICLLFQIISHPGVVDSAILEQEVANIYRVLLGVDGTRLQSIFNFILGLVRGWSAISATNESSEMQVLAVSCGILIKAIDSSTSNIVNPRFQSIVTEIDHFRESCAAPDNKFYSMQTSKYLDYARRRLGIGQSLPSPTDRAPQSSSRACFSLGQELPGALSRRGQRHDNDHEDICDIKLMPTFEEIMSARDEYLPGIDASQHHVQGIQGLLDRQFRLLREDSFYDLRNAIRADLDTLAGRSAVMEPSRLRTKVVAYDRPTATDILFNRQNGLELVIKFGQPRNIRKSNRAERSAWWTRTKRLNPGSFVCLLDEVNNVLFFLVSMSTEVVSKEKSLQQPGNSKGGHKGTEDGDEKQSFTLADDSDHAYVHLQLADPTTDEVKQCLRWYKSMGSRQARRMLEFPGILMPSVLPPLKALQAMSRKMDIPFQHLLVPSQSNPSPKNEPPLYAMKAGFTFDLSSLSNDGTELTYSPTETPDPMSLSRHSTLDYTQAEAILNSLRRSMALTQGPPGTGKSYTGEALIKVLLANKKAANLGPIVCVCYTNHALDQLLEHLVDGGVTQIVRIGSRSKSDRLADVNLRVVARGQTRTRTEGRVLFESREELDSETRFLTGRLSAFKYTKTDEKIRDWLNGHHPRIARDIFGTFSDNDDGWKTVEKPKQKILQKWLESGPHSDAEPRPLNLLYQLDTSTLCRQDRLTLYQDWLQKALASTLGSVAASHTSYSELRDHDLRLKQEIDLRCLQEANIIGVTTTGLARQLELLRKVHAKVLVCEEAGEVLEGHLLTALLPTVEHAILIGDHLQLRPQIQDWRLQRANPAGEKYSLDVSLFERLVSPRHDGGSTLSRSILNTQRRMHPSISELIRSTLYPALVDSANVQEYPEIPGMGKRLFWLHHEVPEAGRNGQDSVDTSYSNDYEVKMVSALVSHLLRQGTYRAGDIAVLTPYLGQLSKLRQSLGATFQIVLNDRDAENLAETGDDPASPAATAATTTGVLSPVAKSNSLQEVRAATVDNFQGEEAKVVIVSLVRSNNEKKCGFLSTSNRINVLLSRAQHGMYIIGNVETSSHVPMWAKVVNLLQQGDNIGPKLELQCPRHPTARSLVSEPEDFSRFAPDGGCSVPCDRRLACGHSCTGPCHSEVLHNAVKCLEACARPKIGCDHACPRPCGEACDDKCMEMMNGLNMELECGHSVASARCWQAREPESIRCFIKVTRSVPGCQHEITTCCYQSVTGPNYACRLPCGFRLPCGHVCKRRCCDCRDRQNGEVVSENHGVCQQDCGKSFKTCSHTCSATCHGDLPCSPCPKPCENRCQHSKCDKKCHEPCAPCAETTCSSSCPHSKCNMPCAAPCDWVPCSRRCEKTLDCGHQCPSLCGEDCPDKKFCQHCASEDVKSIVVDLFEMKEYKDIDLDKEPCIFPDCGHPLTYPNMDGQMSLRDHYTLSPDDVPIAILAPSQPFGNTDGGDIKVCPQCRGSLRNIARYGRVVRRGLLDESTKKFITWSNNQFKKLFDKFADAEGELLRADTMVLENSDSGMPDLTASRVEQISGICKATTLSRYKSLKSVRIRTATHMSKLGKDEQPYQRVANVVNFVSKKRHGVDEFAFDDKGIQMGGYLQTMALLLRCDLLILSDFVSLCRREILLHPEFRKRDVSCYVKDCQKLIDLAKGRELPRQQVEGHIFMARFCALSPLPETKDSATDSTEKDLREVGKKQLELAKDLLDRFKSTEPLTPEYEAALLALNGGVFYSDVSAAEKKAVYLAMSAEFRGTGHWYTCERGHPFTIGECGMPMQLARCPECDAPVGGQSHQAAAGVSSATEFEALGRSMGGMRL